MVRSLRQPMRPPGGMRQDLGAGGAAKACRTGAARRAAGTAAQTRHRWRRTSLPNGCSGFGAVSGCSTGSASCASPHHARPHQRQGTRPTPGGCTARLNVAKSRSALADRSRREAANAPSLGGGSGAARRPAGRSGSNRAPVAPREPAERARRFGCGVGVQHRLCTLRITAPRPPPPAPRDAPDPGRVHGPLERREKPQRACRPIKA